MPRTMPQSSATTTRRNDRHTQRPVPLPTASRSCPPTNDSSESNSHDVQSLNFWKVCSKTNDSFIFLILFTISGDCREALPSFPSNLPRTSVRGLRKTGRAGRSSECASDSFVPARFYLEILIFSYSLIILQRIHRARHPRGPRVLPFIFTRKSFYQGHRPRGSCAFSFPILRPRPTKRYLVCYLRLMFIHNCLFLVKYSDSINVL